MFFDLGIGQLARNHLSCGICLKNGDPDWAGNPTRVRMNDVLNRPYRKKHSLADVWLTIMAEDIDKEAKKRISGKLP